VSEKYSFIDAEKANYPITKACRWLAVSRSGYYDWAGAGSTVAARRRRTLAGLVAEVHAHSRQTYGARRVMVSLRRSGWPVSRRLVGQLLREQGLVACQPRPWRRTTVPGEQPAAVPDRLARDFTASTPGTRLVGDITSIRTWTGWLYLATVIDLSTRTVIGWSMAEHLRTSLIIDAVSMAHGTGRLAPGCVFHSDRGAQGGFQGSSQHLGLEGVVDGGEEGALFGFGWSSAVVVAWASAGGRAAGAAAILGEDRRGCDH